MRLDLSDVFTYSQIDHRIPEAEIRRVENEHQFLFPVGYREFVTTLGYGSLSHLIDVLEPQKCIEYTPRQREVYLECFPGSEPASFVGSSWIVAFCAGEWTTCWYAPRERVIYGVNDGDECRRFGPDLLEAAHTICTELRTAEADDDRQLVFHPFRQRQRYVFDRDRPHRGETYDDWYEAEVDTWLQFDRHELWEQDGRRGDTNRNACFYYREFGGWMSITLGSGGVSLVLSQDRGAARETLDAAFALAAQHGYRARPHPHDQEP